MKITQKYLLVKPSQLFRNKLEIKKTIKQYPSIETNIKLKINQTCYQQKIDNQAKSNKQTNQI